MKIFKVILVLGIVLFGEMLLPAQSADNIIKTYVKAIGGKKKMSKINSLYTESTADLMGNEAVMKTTVLNGKGYKMEMEIMGASVITCINDQGGWTVNPLMGGSSPEDMPEETYNDSKSQIYIGGLFTIYKEQGYTAELLGKENVGGKEASKVQLTAPWGKTSVFYFDAATGYLVKSIEEAESQGQVMETVINYSDYKEVGGMMVPHMLDLDVGGMFQMTSNVTKAEVNKPVDPSVFAKP